MANLVQPAERTKYTQDPNGQGANQRHRHGPERRSNSPAGRAGKWSAPGAGTQMFASDLIHVPLKEAGVSGGKCRSWCNAGYCYRSVLGNDLPESIQDCYGRTFRQTGCGISSAVGSSSPSLRSGRGSVGLRTGEMESCENLPGGLTRSCSDGQFLITAVA